MEVKTLSLKKENILALGEFVLLLSLSIFAPYLKFQWLTGPIVNAILFVSTILLGSSSAILIGLIPSVVSLSTGLLPIVLAPMIPFIMLGNTILILTFDFLKKKNYWLAIVSSSFLKFFFLFLTSEAVINLLLKKETATKVASMMSWPQFFTALAGGAIAYLFLKSIKKK